MGKEEMAKQTRVFQPIQEDLLETSEASMRRSENVQILIALGVLGLAGTLFAQGLIEFPLLSDASESSIVQWSFRFLVYSTALFLIAKLITSTFYPSSDSDLFLLVHEWIQPFVYSTSVALFISVTLLEIISQNTALPLPNLFAIIIGGVIAIYSGYKYSERTAATYEEHRELEANEIQGKILSEIARRHAWDEKINKKTLFRSIHIDSQNRARNILEKMISDENIPIDDREGNIRITDKNKMAIKLKELGLSESQVRMWLPSHIKKSPTANPETETDRTFYCQDCKKWFAEGEMTELQIDNRECPECAGGLELIDDPSMNRR